MKNRPKISFKEKEIRNPIIKFFVILLIVILSPIITIAFFTGILTFDITDIAKNEIKL